MIGSVLVHAADLPGVEGDFDGGAELGLLHELLHVVVAFDRDEGLSFHCLLAIIFEIILLDSTKRSDNQSGGIEAQNIAILRSNNNRLS